VFAADYNVFFVLRILHAAGNTFKGGAVVWAGKFVVGAAPIALAQAGKGAFLVNLKPN
jgi:hypothetical protein